MKVFVIGVYKNIAFLDLQNGSLFQGHIKSRYTYVIKNNITHVGNVWECRIIGQNSDDFDKNAYVNNYLIDCEIFERDGILMVH